jgi:methylphosphotriester-DNA--protein-cysteine methyltransferase
MKKFLSMVMAFVMTLALSGVVLAQAPAGYVASKGGEKFHTTDCPVAKKITAEKLVKFTTPDEAIKAGYTPCKTCNPPTSADALVATKAGGKYHKQNCRMVGSMDTANKVYYKDVAAAEKDGYKSCAICFKK